MNYRLSIVVLLSVMNGVALPMHNPFIPVRQAIERGHENQLSDAMTHESMHEFFKIIHVTKGLQCRKERIITVSNHDNAFDLEKGRAEKKALPYVIENIRSDIADKIVSMTFFINNLDLKNQTKHYWDNNRSFVSALMAGMNESELELLILTAQKARQEKIGTCAEKAFITNNIINILKFSKKSEVELSVGQVQENFKNLFEQLEVGNDSTEYWKDIRRKINTIINPLNIDELGMLLEWVRIAKKSRNFSCLERDNIELYVIKPCVGRRTNIKKRKGPNHSRPVEIISSNDAVEKFDAILKNLEMGNSSLEYWHATRDMINGFIVTVSSSDWAALLKQGRQYRDEWGGSVSQRHLMTSNVLVPFSIKIQHLNKKIQRTSLVTNNVSNNEEHSAKGSQEELQVTRKRTASSTDNANNGTESKKPRNTQ